MHETLIVRLETVAVGISCTVEPPHRHAFRVPWRIQEPIENLFKGDVGWVRVSGKHIDFGNGRWQAGQVERRAANERFARCFMGW